MPDSSMRIERDGMGEVAVPDWAYWGAQTQRSLNLFKAGGERYRWRPAVIRALGLLKVAAAEANLELGELPPQIAELIIQAANQVVSGELDAHFPLMVYQTGSGTQSNMNANEVIANRANQLAGQPLGGKHPVHPNDHVNRGQSSNDVFPSAMHLAIAQETHHQLLPTLRGLRDTLATLAQRNDDLVKSGRTHLQDAAPVTLGQEIGGWVSQLTQVMHLVEQALDGLYPLAIGGTAVGTGLNAHPDFGATVARLLSRKSGQPFTSAENKFAALAAHDGLVQFSASLRTAAGALMKIANDIRWLASGPRCGIGELRLPANEPGSSIMPGKVNPTQCEALSMICVQVFGNDAAAAFAGSQGNFQLNVYKPVMLHNVMESVVLLAEGCDAFNRHCASGIEPDRERINSLLANNLMLVTALVPHIGYDKSTAITRLAQENGLSLKQAALDSGHVSEEQFERWVNPSKMTRPGT